MVVVLYVLLFRDIFLQYFCFMFNIIDLVAYKWYHSTFLGRYCVLIFFFRVDICSNVFKL
jgi:hypothetical protein